METNSDSIIPRVERINLLMDIYGDLLTEKQRRFVALHYSEDLSFGEIAAQFNVSRQAIYDAVKHAVSNLEHYEKTLSLLNKFGEEARRDQVSAEAGHSPTKASSCDYSSRCKETIMVMKQLRTKIQRQSIIYNVDPITHEITRIIGMIDALLMDSEGSDANASKGDKDV